MSLKESIVLYPSRGKGHLIPMVELAKLFVRHGFSATIVLIEVASDPSSPTDPFFSRVTSAYPSISFHRLPAVALTPSKPPIYALSESAALANPHLLHFLRSTSSGVRAIVLDIFCGAALDVASELRVPSYFFYTSCASTLALFLLFQNKLRELGGGSSSSSSGSPFRFPGLPPIPARDLPSFMLDGSEAGRSMLRHCERWPRADGIIVNTFESLERRAVRALLDYALLPPIYCIGPLTANRNEEGGKEGGEKHECLSWLDAQPEESVVFLCFGSMGAFPAEQLREIAAGLERSGQRFLWVVRSPDADAAAKKFAAWPEPDLEALLPAGFLERTGGRGLVARSWAPQTAVLAHGSVGGFVSHCGWNSALEAVSSGVPVIAWPLFAEQGINKVVLVEEAKVAVAMDGYEEGLVGAEEVERKIRWLMASEEGRVVRDRMAAAKERAVAAMKEDGESTLAWLEVVKAIRKDNPDIGA